MPELAARLADVGVRDPHPLEAGGIRAQGLDPLSVGLFDVCAVLERAACVFDADSELVAHRLQVTDVEQTGPAAGGQAPFEPAPRIRGGEESGELPLELRDL